MSLACLPTIGIDSGKFHVAKFAEHSLIVNKINEKYLM